MNAVKFAFVVLFGLSVCACGSNNDNSSPTAPTPTPTTPAPAPTPTPSGTTVTIGGGAETAGAAAFGMNPLTVATGTTVTWHNSDTVPHTATSDSAGVFNTGTINAGGSASFTFSSAGTMHYHCTIHPGMVGTIVVQ
jgi:plastocyanin